MGRRQRSPIDAIAGEEAAEEMTFDLVAELLGIKKSFGAVQALAGVDWDLRRGEVHALLGENGAGKTTLCSILAGAYRPDAGRLCINGADRVLSTPRDGLAHGVGLVYQDFRLVRTLTVAENLALASPDGEFILRRQTIEKETADIAQQFGLDVRPSARVSDLSMGEQQRVEIIKLLMRETTVLMLDEPTSVLTPQESASLFATIRKLSASGRSVVLVSHKLEEVCEIADRITVLRDGHRVAQVNRDEVEPRDLARLMVGRAIQVAPKPPRSSSGAVALTLDGIRVSDDRGRETVHGINLVVRQHEIVGIAGVAGNGQRELADAIAGLRRCAAGTIRLGADGHNITHATVRRRSDLGLAYIPDDRLGTGVAPGLTPWVNLALRNVWRRMYSCGPFLRTRKLQSNAQRLGQEFAVRGLAADGQVRRLSGGNLQRLILARELEHQPQVVIAASPTRGLDISAAVATHRLLFQQCAAGASVLLISEDLDELLMISDRLAVMYEGQIIGECVAGEVTLATIGAWMAGHSDPGEAADRVSADIDAVSDGVAGLGNALRGEVDG